MDKVFCSQVANADTFSTPLCFKVHQYMQYRLTAQALVVPSLSSPWLPMLPSSRLSTDAGALPRRWPCRGDMQRQVSSGFGYALIGYQSTRYCLSVSGHLLLDITLSDKCQSVIASLIKTSFAGCSINLTDEARCPVTPLHSLWFAVWNSPVSSCQCLPMPSQKLLCS